MLVQTIVALALPVAFLSGCVTKAQEKELRNEIFALQTRTQQLEAAIVESSKSNKSQGMSVTQQSAAATIRIEVVEREMQKVKGDIDALRIGVKTGQLPGVEDTGDSVAQRLAVVMQRVEAIEAAQAEILEQLSKTPEKKSTREPAKKEKTATEAGSEAAINSVKELKEAYGKNRFKAVATAAPQLLQGKLKKGDKEDTLYLQAESMFKLGQVKEAALKFNELLDLNPGAEKAAQARMRMGDCFRHLGDNNTARIYYEELVQKHPKSAQAQKAKERLSKAD